MTQIVIDVPYLTIKEFSRRSGMNIETIKKKISAGLIPTMKRKSAQQKALINMVALTKQALAEANAEII